MKTRKIIIYSLLVVAIMFFSCIRHPTTILEDNPQKTKELLGMVEAGDTVAYYKISIDFFLADKSKEFLFYALIMANKYNDAQAHYDVYRILTDFFDSNIETLDTITKELALYHLKKSKELELGNQ
jgi:hypothetical protein